MGEHLESVGLAAGEETIFEIRAFRRQSRSIEDVLEREYERNMESSTQDTDTDSTSDNTSDNQGSSNADSNQGSLRLSAPADTVPVEAQGSTASSDTIQHATTTATQISCNRSITTSKKASARLRTSHKITSKETIETGLETLTRKVIRNPNPISPISLHYFKVMQRLELQQQRLGMRLCWAPFVLDPGAALRRRMRDAAEAVLQAALDALDLPAPPTPPEPKMAPSWREGIGEIVQAGPGGQFHEILHLHATVNDGEVFTGDARVRKEGSGAARTAVNIFDVDSAPDDNGRVSMDVNVIDGADYLGIFDEVFVTPLIKILRAVPGYEQKYVQYQDMLNTYQTEVARLTRTARYEAQPEADAAAMDILGKTDIRSELMGAVVDQFLRPGSSAGSQEIEYWTRMFEFENASYQIYPGWWCNRPLPLPMLGSESFVNASIARVFLPVRPGYESKFVDETLVPSLPERTRRQLLGMLLGKLVKPVTEGQKEFLDNNQQPKPIALGASWTEFTPTNGVHVETEICATTAADLTTERQVTAAVEQLEESVKAEAARNAIRASPPASSTVTVSS
jgi:hypothetical protein